MKNHNVRGDGGLQLHVQETGNPGGKPILFIHGFSQCRLAWAGQMQSDLARDFRLVAMDLRGHGLSDKPTDDSYASARPWAQDVDAVIKALDLDRPVLVGWSYAGMIMTDYVAAYGEDRIAGTCWIGAVSRLGEPLMADGFLGDQFVALLPGTFSDDATESAASLEKLIRLCTNDSLTAEQIYPILGYNAVVPPHVRRTMFARDVSNDRIVESMRKPMLVLWGERDEVVLPKMASHLAKLAKNARVSIYPDAGHALFAQAPDRFNRELREFRQAV